jgi:hypothetical protein
MNGLRFVGAVTVVLAVGIAAPALTGLIHAAVPLVIVAGIIFGALRIVWAATRRW